MKTRIDRREHILNEFKDKSEFTVRLIEAKQHRLGTIGLWKSITHIINDAKVQGYEYILLCEDDHQFTESYDKRKLINAIHLADQQKAEVLLGGVSWLSSIFSIKDHLCWIEAFNGAQFMILFNRSFERMLNATFSENNCADIKISELFDRKFLIFPFISVQKGFGYSDVTPKNADLHFLSQLFVDADHSIQYMLEGERFYNSSIQGKKGLVSDYDYDDVSIPTFVRQTDLKDNNTKGVFGEKSEFDIQLLESRQINDTLHTELEYLRKVVQLSIKQDCEVIFYCSSLSRLSREYRKKEFLKGIISAYLMGASLIYTSHEGSFNHAVPISDSLLWIDKYSSICGIIIFKRMFDSILSQPAEHDESLQDFISRLSSNKLIMASPLFEPQGNSLTSSRLNVIVRNFLLTSESN
ncbi:hypothetical protein [Dyadobacter alkalitolerans]|uniref:hypothetical protein n=1 Tax=Dyadobacter alkalitolerans TaxID=492736 RepID=UPI0012FB2092|nr:hypothetical protein [Dyadobacter alkalitolerans]